MPSGEKAKKLPPAIGAGDSAAGDNEWIARLCDEIGGLGDAVGIRGGNVERTATGAESGHRCGGVKLTGQRILGDGQVHWSGPAGGGSRNGLMERLRDALGLGDEFGVLAQRLGEGDVVAVLEAAATHLP